MIKLDFDSVTCGAILLPEKQERLQEAVNRVFQDIEGVIGIRCVSESVIQRLNRQYRKKDQVTDVLSFTYQKDACIGDVAICTQQAKRQAHTSIEQEVVRLVTHGVLHILGYDHERPGEDAEMFELEDKIIDDYL